MMKGKQMNLKVLLINPVYNPGSIPKNIPLSSIATGLLNCNIGFKVIDFLRPDCEQQDLQYFIEAENCFIQSIEEIAEEFDYVYITTGTGCELKPYPLFPRVQKIAKAIKQRRSIPIIVGGALINLYSKVYGLSEIDIKGNYVDYIIVGNEYQNVMKFFMKDRNFPASVIPSWEIWENKYYPDYQSVQYRVGCPFSCDFCFEGKIYDRANNTTSLSDFVAAIPNGGRIIIEDSVIISNDDFEEMMDMLCAKKVQFAAYARISEIVSNPKKIEKMHLSGCKALIIGIETLDYNILHQHNKGIVSKQTLDALSILKDNSIAVQGCFMLGFPGDTLNNMEKTIQFAIDEKLNGYRWHIYQPNFFNLPSQLYLPKEKNGIAHLFDIQLNVPDCCLGEIIKTMPVFAKMDEHFMIRAKKYIGADVFSEIGYKESFRYSEIKELIDRMFLPQWILNEEKLYKELFV